MQPSQQNKRKIDKLANLLEKGNLAIAEHIFEMEEKFDDTLEKVEARSLSLDKILERVKGKDGEDGATGERGEKGDTGERGEKGDKGQDGKDGRDGKDGTKGQDGKNGRDGKDGLDGKDAELPDLEELTINTINFMETLEGDDRLDAKAVKNLPDLSGYTDEVKTLQNRTQLLLQIATQRANTSSTTGGSSIGGMSQVITVSGTIDDSNVTFTSAQEPDLLVINGGIYKTTGGAITWTYSAGTITLSSAVGTGGTIFGLEQSIFDKAVFTILINDDIALTTGDGKAYFRVPEEIDGWVLTAVCAARASGTGVPSFQIHNVTQTLDMLSTNITIDSGETDSTTAATPPVINTSNDTVAGANRIRIDCDAAGTSSLWDEIQVVFERP